MSDNVLIITGGSRGIGAATALLAAERGYGVVVNYAANATAAEAVCGAIHTKGGAAVAVAVCRSKPISTTSLPRRTGWGRWRGWSTMPACSMWWRGSRISTWRG